LTKPISRIEEMRIVGAYLIKNVMEKSHLEDIVLDVRAILKYVLNTQVLGCEI
jgi:predicted transcriptional regulator